MPRNILPFFWTLWQAPSLKVSGARNYARGEGGLYQTYGFSGVLIRHTPTWLVPATTPRNQLPATNTRMMFEIRTTYWLGDSTTHVLNIVQFLAGMKAFIGKKS